MSTAADPLPDPTARPRCPDDRPVLRSEAVFGAVMAVLFLLLCVAGVPGSDEPVAGNGSERLRLGWSSQFPAGPGADDSSPAPAALPTGRGREPAAR